MLKLSQGTLTLAGLAIFAIWLFGVLPFLYGPPPRFAETGRPPQAHTDQAEQQPAAKPDGSISAPFFIRIPKTAKEEAEEAADRREKSSTDRWLMIFTGAVALFTLLLVGATVMLYFAGEKQLRLAREAGKRQSDEMLESIAAANRSAAVAERALIATDRAWISISAGIIGPLVFDNKTAKISIKPTMTNVGKSPATHIDLYIELCPSIEEAGERSVQVAKNMISSRMMFDSGVVLFPGEKFAREDAPLQMDIAKFKAANDALPQFFTDDGSGIERAPTGHPAIMACATYRLPADREPHQTIILFELKHTNPAHHGWDGSVWETPSDHLRLVQTFMSGQAT